MKRDGMGSANKLVRRDRDRLMGWPMRRGRHCGWVVLKYYIAFVDELSRGAENEDGERSGRRAQATMEFRDALLLCGPSRGMGCQPVTSGNPREQPPFSRGLARWRDSRGIEPRRRSIWGGETGAG